MIVLQLGLKSKLNSTPSIGYLSGRRFFFIAPLAPNSRLPSPSPEFTAFNSTDPVTVALERKGHLQTGLARLNAIAQGGKD
ncbi:MAG TPA: hypothetical protein V6C65_12225 [Allocoleopsis sp.]